MYLTLKHVIVPYTCLLLCTHTLTYMHDTCFSDCVTSSYVALRPFEDCSLHAPTVEVDEFVQDSSKFAQPYRVYKNHIYIYPKHLKYDSQKSFAKVSKEDTQNTFTIHLHHITITITICLTFLN